jgi:SAM-dependent methyltransferase
MARKAAVNMSKVEFDEFARKYEETLERTCAISGESPEFYAVERMQWCRRRLHRWLPADTVLDFGCGIGGSTSYFFDTLGCKSVIAVDPSVESLRVAKERYSGRNVRLTTPGEFTPSGDIPLAFCNGVFHHILPAERLQALAYIRAALSENGILAFWENNPWNPIVVYGMSLNEFDRDAQTLSPPRSTRLLKAAGFRVRFIDYCFFFPHFARGLRPLEPALRWLPLGAQYLVVAQNAKG